jgi:glucuronate isomerase
VSAPASASAASVPLTLHPDRALPADPGVRKIAQRLYAQTKDLPLICMHGHVEASAFAENTPFADPAQLLIVPDHYVFRMLASQGIDIASLGVPRQDGGPVETDSRTIWRAFCENWKLFRGTPSRYWIEHELVEVFDVHEAPSAESADRIYDQISAVVARPEFRPQQLLDTFGIEIISTTDPASSDLAHHASLAQQGLGERVVPTFRPDAALMIGAPAWRDEVTALGAAADVDTATYGGFLEALRVQRRKFVAAGARATDHGHLSASTQPMDESDAADLFRRVLDGQTPTEAESAAFEAHMLLQMAGMSCEDGLVMQIHPGVLRDHSTTILYRHGKDKGYDIPVAMEYTRALRPMLERHGLDPNFHCILFTIDETVYSRELAPIAGTYPSVRLGAPWWFLDSPDGMRRFREAATETAGFYNTSGFVDDTRAFASIPARHDLSRRIDAGYLARLVAEHRLGETEAIEVAIDLAANLPRESYPPIAH